MSEFTAQGRRGGLVCLLGFGGSCWRWRRARTFTPAVSESASVCLLVRFLRSSQQRPIHRRGGPGPDEKADEETRPDGRRGARLSLLLLLLARGGTAERITHPRADIIRQIGTRCCCRCTRRSGRTIRACPALLACLLACVAAFSWTANKRTDRAASAKRTRSCYNTYRNHLFETTIASR